MTDDLPLRWTQRGPRLHVPRRRARSQRNVDEPFPLSVSATPPFGGACPPCRPGIPIHAAIIEVEISALREEASIARSIVTGSSVEGTKEIVHPVSADARIHNEVARHKKMRRATCRILYSKSGLSRRQPRRLAERVGHVGLFPTERAVLAGDSAEVAVPGRLLVDRLEQV